MTSMYQGTLFLNPRYRLLRHPSGAVVLLDEQHTFVLQDAVAARLLELIDGKRGVEDLALLLCKEAPSQILADVVTQLLEARILEGGLHAGGHSHAVPAEPGLEDKQANSLPLTTQQDRSL